jgi:hypothetical protein
VIVFEAVLRRDSLSLNVVARISPLDFEKNDDSCTTHDSLRCEAVLLDNIDLHSLKVLSAIFETGSLSHTAARLEVSQPAVSITLSKLRKHFDDQLFVQVGTRMQPTPQALGMIDNVKASIAAMEATLNYRVAFDPKKCSPEFHYLYDRHRPDCDASEAPE